MERDEIICAYHTLGLRQKEILTLLNIHGFSLSERQLRRVLHSRNMFRRRNVSDIVTVATFLADQLNSSGQQQGYRFMHLRCVLSGLSVSREKVRILLQFLDPEGVDLRRRRRLVRRRYYANGPNYIWHIDSYDKLKPYGIALNGCIDGFSRYVVWLEANFTASDPKVVGGYFTKTVEDLGGCPKFMRGDRGTENCIIRQMFLFLREEDMDGNSFMYGRSTANQRIENWWSFLRRQLTEFWICFFHELKETGSFNGEEIEKELIRFTFMDIIQAELDEFVMLWNLHLLRKSRNDQLAHGRPILMYTSPEQYDTQDYMCPVENRHIEACKEECTFKNGIPCDPDVYQLCLLIMQENGWNAANNATSARELYIRLRREVLNLL